MSDRRVIESMEEAVAIAKGELPEDAYRVHIPEDVDVKAIRNRLGLPRCLFPPVSDCPFTQFVIGNRVNDSLNLRQGHI
jgi:hypothetical protein